VMNQPPAFVPAVPPAPPVNQPVINAVPPTPPAPPANVFNQAAPAVAPAGPSVLGIPATEIIRCATVGDLYNNGRPVAVVVTDNYLVLVPQGGAPVVEEVPGIRHAVVGDYDGDGTEDLALFSDTHVWVNRYSEMGSVRSGKVALQTVPQHLVRAPFTTDGRAVLMSTAGEKISFYVLHPSRGLVEIAATPVPAIEP
ncbi:MAG TPA: VCBS repeat-containing protein, partial [Symbiobacteriaceae bacterium]|nr:VCBS repeat-containing protein [Symbiobacteriaceae bacterium]